MPRAAKKRKHLVIVESPTKARTLSRMLGSGYKVMASMGHVRDLLKSRLGVDPKKGFAPSYRVLPDKRQIVTDIAREASRAGTVFLAPDPDREGEAIAWHLLEAARIPPEKACRVTFHEITERVVREAFAHPGAIDMHKVNAQQARRILDRLVGYHLSPLLWKKIAFGLSAGRVQSVAVRLIVERERLIEAFVPEVYWRVTARLRPGSGDPFEALLVEWDGRPVRTAAEPPACAKEGDALTLDATQAGRIVDALSGEPFSVARVEEEDRFRKPPPPLTTSLLQQSAVALGYSAKRAMAIAQQLYQGIAIGEEGPVGLITYMRTDSVRFSPEALAECRDLIRKRFSPAHLPKTPNVFPSRKGAQEAHEAIRPTSFARTPETMKPFLTREQARLYRLIWNRAVASQMSSAHDRVTRLTIRAGGGRFGVSGSVEQSAGYRVVLPRAETETLLPALREGEPLALLTLIPSRHETTPPARYGEASLVRELERLGIGRPSTYAPIVSTVQERGYVEKKERRLAPTPMGRMVTEMLLSHFSEIMDVRFTSRMEEELDEVEEGKRRWRKVLRDFYGPFSKVLAAAEIRMRDVKGTVETTDEKCPQCGRGLLVKWSRWGKFLGCSGFADEDPERKCDYRRPFEAEEARPTGIVCDACGGVMLAARGRFGPYLKCERYPRDCAFTMKIDKRGHPVRKFAPIPTDLACEKCGKLFVVRVSARGKRGPRPFLSCSNFPKCRATSELPEPLAGAGAQAVARWEANAVKNRNDLIRYKVAQDETGEGEGGKGGGTGEASEAEESSDGTNG